MAGIVNDLAFRSDALNVISVCAGGGGLDLALELAVPSARSICFLEGEAFGVATLVAAMQDGFLAPAPIWGDVRTFDGLPWRGLVDGVIGGIPCQAHSHAGRKLGQLDERDLWSPTRRIIVQCRPWFALIENVGGMLTAGADEVAGAERVRRDLRKLGYAIEGGLFTASETGASHDRERIFILGINEALVDPEGFGSYVRRGPDSAGHGQTAIGFADRGAELADPDRNGYEGRQPARSTEAIRRRLGDSGDALADAGGPGLEGGEFGGSHGSLDGRATSRPASELRGSPMGDAASERSRPVSIFEGGQDEADADLDRPGLFPPGPGDLDGWHAVLGSAPELEPSFRRVADGLAARMDFARIDRLRMLGNGVVPLQGAYAIRSLATALARTSAGAGILVRMMEE